MLRPEDVLRLVRCRALVLALALGTGRAAQGQGLVARGDALIRRGRVLAAESLYYDAAARAPRDPRARLALGRYLAARGALRVGAVLLEEARYFGADSAAVARELAPVYARIGDYAALAALPHSPLSGPERARAAWLRDHPPATAGDDSATLAFAPPSDAGALGTFRAWLGGDSITVAVDPSVVGWVIDASLAARLRPFGDGRGVADLRLGGIALDRAPVRVATGPPAERRARRRRGERSAKASAARVGLDALGAFAPSFDAAAGVLTLRRDGRVRRVAGLRLPALLDAGGEVHAGTNGALASLATPAGRALLPAAARWTFDARRGEIVVER